MPSILLIPATIGVVMMVSPLFGANKKLAYAGFGILMLSAFAGALSGI